MRSFRSFFPLLSRPFSTSLPSVQSPTKCTRTKNGRLIPVRPEKYFADYTTLSRAEIIGMWRKGELSVTPPSSSVESQGTFMSDILIFEEDNVAINEKPLFPSLLPFHPQYGHLPRIQSELGREGGEVEKKGGASEEPDLFEWKKEGPVVPTIVMAVNKPAGVVVSRSPSHGQRSRTEMSILRDIVAKHTKHTSDLRLPPGLLHSLLFHKLSASSPSLPLLPPPPYFFEKEEIEEKLEKDGKKGGLKDWVVCAHLAGLFPIGRLDKDTSGLLLFTNDGDFATAMTEIGNISRHYLCSLRYHEDENDGEKGWTYNKEDRRIKDLLEKGVELQDGLGQPNSMGVRKTKEKAISEEKEFKKSMNQNQNQSKKKKSKLWKVEVEVREGRNRLVRRMVSASKLGHLTALHRFKIGDVSLPSLGLKPGEWGQLKEQQVEGLWGAIGGRERVVERKIEALKQQASRMREINRPSTRLEEWLVKNQ